MLFIHTEEPFSIFICAKVWMVQWLSYHSNSSRRPQIGLIANTSSCRKFNYVGHSTPSGRVLHPHVDSPGGPKRTPITFSIRAKNFDRIWVRIIVLPELRGSALNWRWYCGLGHSSKQPKVFHSGIHSYLAPVSSPIQPGPQVGLLLAHSGVWSFYLLKPSGKTTRKLKDSLIEG